MDRHSHGGAGPQDRREAHARQRCLDAHTDALLSAYLDGQLSAGSRARLEARLASDADLRVELDALRRTVALVRDMPPAPLPRNFLLSTAPERTSRRLEGAQGRAGRLAWAAPLLTAASAAVATMLAVVVAGQVLVSNAAMAPLQSAGAGPAPAESVPVAATEQRDMVVEEDEAWAEAAPTAEAVAKEAAVPEAPADMAAEGATAAPGEAEMAAEAMPAAGALLSAEEDTAAPSDAEPREAELLAASPEPAVVEPTSVPEGQEMVPEAAAAEMVAEQPEGAGGAGQEAPYGVAEAPAQVPEAELVGPASPLAPWLVIEGVLGVALVGLVVATVCAWRARNRRG